MVRAQVIPMLPTSSHPDLTTPGVPQEVGGADRSSRRRVNSAGALLLVAVALALRLSGASASDVGGELLLNPTAPAPGATVHATYRPGATLAARRYLVLRARYRVPGDPSYDFGIPTRTAAVLERHGSSFTGTFTLPDTVVYAALAVEDSAADVIDNDHGRFWEILVSAPSGQPLFDALDQRANDLMGRNAGEGFATARLMAKDYPWNLNAWVWLRSFHGWLGWTDVDSIRALHVAKLKAFDRRLSAQDTVSAADLGLMAWYAAGVRDTILAKKWRDRLMREAPDNTFAVQWRMFDVLQRLGQSHDTAAALAALDTLWIHAPSPRRGQVAGYAFSLAQATSPTGVIRQWADRIGESEPSLLARHSWTRSYASLLTTLPPTRSDVAALHAEGRGLLRSELAWLSHPGPGNRRLGETRARQEERLAGSRRQVYAALGKALIADGHRSGGLDTLALAAAAGWDLSLFGTIAQGRLVAGDTAGALDMDARVAVDPRTDSTYVTSVQPLVNALGEPEWHARLDTARSEFARRMLAEGVDRALPGPVHLTDATGRHYDLGHLTGGHVSVVVFSSRFCGGAVQALPATDTLAARLAGEGVNVFGIVEEKPSPEFASFLREKGVRMPMYHDVNGEASRAFNNWGTPGYYVLDARGKLRFDEADSPDEVLAQVEALRMEPDGK
jgi:hypothetical protein